MSTLKLYNKSQDNKVLIPQLEVADGFAARAIGLLGKKSMAPNSSLWIKKCSRIHTWFMNFPIDVIFVDKHLVVKMLYKKAKPWRHFYLGAWSADSVFEMPHGTLENLTINIGDQLYVGS